MSGVEKAKRDRVAKACATCRRKKIKCNGQTPCDHCSHLNLPCEYPNNKPRKSRLKTSLEMVQNRLDRLESLLFKIALRVGDLDNHTIPSPDSANQLGGDENSSSSSSPALEQSYKESREEIQENGNRDLGIRREPSRINGSQSIRKSEESFFQQCKSILHQTIEGDSDVGKKSQQMLQYKGLHLGIVFIFSNQSIEWIKSKLKTEDHNIVVPFHSLFFYFNAWKQHFLSVWTDPKVYAQADVKKLKEGVYPHDKQLTFELLRHFSTVVMASFVCDPVEVDDLFTKFYENKTKPPAKKYRFSSSELMVMNLSLAISISVAIDAKSSSVYSPGFGHCPKLELMTIDQLTALQEEMFLNSVFYFHTISVVSEGLVTIQALLLLATHLETTWVITDVNYSFVSMALRYAQEIGLHRFETFQHLSEAEIQKRSRIWAAVQCFDVEISYRTGKPPLVNMVDVSTLTPMDPSYIPALMSRSEIETLQERCGGTRYPLDEIYLHFYHYKLSQLRAFSYFQLFSATVKYDNLKVIQEIVTSLNNELLGLGNEIREEYRPKYYYEQGFSTLLLYFNGDFKLDRTRDCLLSLHLEYFYLIMTVNKVPSQIDPNEGSSPPYENACYRKAALDSSRTILQIMRAVNRKTMPFFLINWNIFYPFVATMNLLSHCLNHYDDSDCYKDLSLLIDLSMNFFNYYSHQAKQPSTKLFYLRLHLFDTLVRIVLRITIKIYEERNNISILSGNPLLKAHLEDVEKEFPQFYSKVHDATDILNLLSCMHGVEQKNGDTFLGLHELRSSSQASPKYTPRDGGQSPRKNDPTLFDILHPVDFASMRDPEKRDYNIDDDILLAAANQDFLALPNFFFDNGL